MELFGNGIACCMSMVILWEKPARQKKTSLNLMLRFKLKRTNQDSNLVALSMGTLETKFSTVLGELLSGWLYDFS